ncbi:type I restriction endonuclease subunit R [Parasulfuritortus cantonensis]|uniref:Type I restriction endonuclease subunit R n=1 Tax=Parasulfuritortus cantonensis TaxID=2528202 RepID=A0A4V2NVK3_9PROT|nr:type I restriction endonuclease [Parasulfuritortus cantonensis]TCJ13822.1 type I restriction endonuclease subunit R [Parasulfuritortus cantonensis]
MNEFMERVRRHAEHVITVGHHCTTEETTKQALILPLLDILGFSPFDPTKVKAEFGADFPGAKANERVDYALFCHGVPVMFIEAKTFGEKLSNHSPQLARYFNATPEVTIGAITNGQVWRFFTDLTNKNVMDSEPFLMVDFAALDESLIGRLYRFRHDEFQPEALRTLAEESIYLAAFKDVVNHSVLECDQDFVRYVAGKSTVQRSLTARFMEVITPIVKQAVAQSMSERVASSLSAPKSVAPEEPKQPVDDPMADQVDPSNPRIVTTYAERRLIEVLTDILGEDAGVVAKDTESYFAALFQGKVNRWLLRYWSEGKHPRIQVIVPMTDERRHEIGRAGLQFGPSDSILLGHPDHLMRIPGILFDALEYCRDDNNFKRTAPDQK